MKILQQGETRDLSKGYRKIYIPFSIVRIKPDIGTRDTICSEPTEA